MDLQWASRHFGYRWHRIRADTVACLGLGCDTDVEHGHWRSHVKKFHVRREALLWSQVPSETYHGDCHGQRMWIPMFCRAEELSAQPELSCGIARVDMPSAADFGQLLQDLMLASNGQPLVLSIRVPVLRLAFRNPPPPDLIDVVRCFKYRALVDSVDIGADTTLVISTTGVISGLSLDIPLVGRASVSVMRSTGHHMELDHIGSVMSAEDLRNAVCEWAKQVVGHPEEWDVINVGSLSTATVRNSMGLSAQICEVASFCANDHASRFVSLEDIAVQRKVNVSPASVTCAFCRGLRGAGICGAVDCMQNCGLRLICQRCAELVEGSPYFSSSDSGQAASDEVAGFSALAETNFEAALRMYNDECRAAVISVRLCTHTKLREYEEDPGAWEEEMLSVVCRVTGLNSRLVVKASIDKTAIFGETTMSISVLLLDPVLMGNLLAKEAAWHRMSILAAIDKAIVAAPAPAPAFSKSEFHTALIRALFHATPPPEEAFSADEGDCALSHATSRSGTASGPGSPVVEELVATTIGARSKEMQGPGEAHSDQAEIAPMSASSAHSEDEWDDAEGQVAPSNDAVRAIGELRNVLGVDMMGVTAALAYQRLLDFGRRSRTENIESLIAEDGHLAEIEMHKKYSTRAGFAARLVDWRSIRPPAGVLCLAKDTDLGELRRVDMQKTLTELAAADDREGIQRLLPSLTPYMPLQCPAFRVALSAGHLGLARWLIESNLFAPDQPCEDDSHPIHLAVVLSRALERSVGLLIGLRANVQAENGDGEAPLSLLLQRGSATSSTLSTLNLLLTAKADPNKHGCEGHPVAMCIRKFLTPAVQRAPKPDPPPWDRPSRWVSCAAAFEQSKTTTKQEEARAVDRLVQSDGDFCLAAIQMLVEYGAETSVQETRSGWSIMHIVTGLGDKHLVRRYMASADSKLSDVGGLTPLHVACYSRDLDLAEMLAARLEDGTRGTLEGEASPKRARRRSAVVVDLGRVPTPLEVALSRGAADIALVLLRTGAKVAPLASRAVKYALRIWEEEHQRRAPVLDALLDRKAHVGATEHGFVLQEILALRSESAATFAVRVINSEACDETVLYSAAGKAGWSALHTAIASRHLDAASALIRRKADPNFEARVSPAETPLRLAAMSTDRTFAVQMCRRLLAARAEVQGTNSAECSALHGAAGARNVDVIRLLLAGDADANAVDSRGWTPLQVAVAMECFEAVEVILPVTSAVHVGVVQHFVRRQGKTVPGLRQLVGEATGTLVPPRYVGSRPATASTESGFWGLRRGQPQLQVEVSTLSTGISPAPRPRSPHLSIVALTPRQPESASARVPRRHSARGQRSQPGHASAFVSAQPPGTTATVRPKVLHVTPLAAARDRLLTPDSQSLSKMSAGSVPETTRTASVSGRPHARFRPRVTSEIDAPRLRLGFSD
mmetsp:Transcript_39847/g.104340  ORF Transcript_39847/g.104340 Transcript_39847/m.104340 type:complete len:1418 (+) Transcript_39847:14-4267(+)